MSKRFVVDLAERAVSTYLEVFIGLLIVTWADITSVSDALTVGRSAAIAAVPAGLAVIKGGLSKFRASPNSASLVNLARDPAAPPA